MQRQAKSPASNKASKLYQFKINMDGKNLKDLKKTQVVPLQSNNLETKTPLLPTHHPRPVEEATGGEASGVWSTLEDQTGVRREAN